MGVRVLLRDEPDQSVPPVDGDPIVIDVNEDDEGEEYRRDGVVPGAVKGVVNSALLEFRCRFRVNVRKCVATMK